jgi:hypothetical protein
MLINCASEGIKAMKIANLQDSVVETIKVLARDAHRRGEQHTLAFLIEHLERASGKQEAQAFRFELSRRVT